MYGDSRENLNDMLAVVTILSPIFSVCGYTRETEKIGLKIIGLFCRI